MQLLDTFRNSGHHLLTFIDYISNNCDINKCVILRHDVDRAPKNSLQMAKLEFGKGIKASYFFRTVGPAYEESIIEKIADLGHEISYHYEDLSYCLGNYEAAIKNFESNLEKLRKYYSVKTICMHGSPLSRIDNKKIWEKYDFRDYGIIADPAFDVDYDEVFYITDTGRSWNNTSASVRDKVKSKFEINIKNTHHLIEKIKRSELPDKIMLNVHPQRWHDAFVPWASELVRQNFKNVLKRCLVKLRSADYG